MPSNESSGSLGQAIVLQYHQAIEAYREAVRLNPKYTDAWNNLGAVYQKAGLSAKAIDALRSAAQAQPDNAVVWYNLGLVCARNGRFSDALDAARRLRVLDPAKADELLRKIKVNQAPPR
jgi:tetratricopeptide (TPR) repeat protein